MFQAANRVKDIDSRASDALKQRKIIVPEFVPGTIPNLKVITCYFCFWISF